MPTTISALTARVRRGNGHVAVTGPSTHRISVIRAQAPGQERSAILCRIGGFGVVISCLLTLLSPLRRTGIAEINTRAPYRETEPMYGKLFSDRASVPELDRFLEENVDRMLAELADELAAAFDVRGRHAERTRALTRLALDFWTWRRLSREGLDDEAAADLMAGAVRAER